MNTIEPRPTCPHGARLTRAEAAQHMACTEYGRAVDARTVDRWANEGLITRYKVGGMQWVRFDRDELDAVDLDPAVRPTQKS